MQNLSLIVVLALTAGAAEAGGWSSSGGRILGDADNPWFLQNTPEVAYCVTVDAETVSADANQADLAFRRAVDFWRGQVTKDTQSADALLVTQTFRRVDDCADPAVALKLQLGAGTLDQAQRDYFGDRLRYFAAVAVRTDYDEVAMRGKGFIYVANDRDQPKPNAWSEEALLLRAIAHELGHVFGVPHTQGTLMDERGPDAWLAQSGRVTDLTPLDFVRTPEIPIGCSKTIDPRFFVNRSSTGLPGLYRCVRFSPIQGHKHAFTVLARPITGGEDVELGTVGPDGLGISASATMTLVRVFLNPRQQVFPHTSGTIVLGNIFPESTSDTYYAFRSVEGWEKPLYITTSIEGMTIVGADYRDAENRIVIRPAVTRFRYYGDWWDED